MNSVYLGEFPVSFHVLILCSQVFLLVFDHTIDDEEWYSGCRGTGGGGGLFDA
jgi:hypothetical protein